MVSSSSGYDLNLPRVVELIPDAQLLGQSDLLLFTDSAAELLLLVGACDWPWDRHEHASEVLTHSLFMCNGGDGGGGENPEERAGS